MVFFDHFKEHNVSFFQVIFFCKALPSTWNIHIFIYIFMVLVPFVHQCPTSTLGILNIYGSKIIQILLCKLFRNTLLQGKRINIFSAKIINVTRIRKKLKKTYHVKSSFHVCFPHQDFETCFFKFQVAEFFLSWRTSSPWNNPLSWKRVFFCKSVKNMFRQKKHFKKFQNSIPCSSAGSILGGSEVSVVVFCSDRSCSEKVSKPSCWSTWKSLK